MPKRAFLSFKMEDKKQVDGVRLMAWSAHVPLDFYDESVRVPYDSTNAEYIRRKITEKIRRCSITVGFLKERTYESKWVSWELQKSRELGKEILLMGLPGHPDTLRLPSSVGDLSWHIWDPDYLTKRLE